MNIYKAYKVHEQEGSGNSAQAETPGQSTLQISDGFVVIDAIASKNAGTLKTDLEALGLKKSALSGRVVSGLFPISEIPKLSALKSLKSVRASLAKTHNIPGSTKGTR